MNLNISKLSKSYSHILIDKKLLKRNKLYFCKKIKTAILTHHCLMITLLSHVAILDDLLDKIVMLFLS